MELTQIDNLGVRILVCVGGVRNDLNCNIGMFNLHIGNRIVCIVLYLSKSRFECYIGTSFRVQKFTNRLKIFCAMSNGFSADGCI